MPTFSTARPEGGKRKKKGPHPTRKSRFVPVVEDNHAGGGDRGFEGKDQHMMFMIQVDIPRLTRGVGGKDGG